MNDSMGIFVESCLRNQHRLSVDALEESYCYDDKKIQLLASYLISLLEEK